MNGQEHIFKLCVPPELYLGIIKFQAEKEIGKPYAGLLLLTKAAYQEKLISREVYEQLVYRYSRKLVNEDNSCVQKTNEELIEASRIANKDKQFSLVLSQWHLHTDEVWRSRWIAEANEWMGKCPNARLIRDLGAKKS